MSEVRKRQASSKAPASVGSGSAAAAAAAAAAGGDDTKSRDMTPVGFASAIWLLFVVENTVLDFGRPIMMLFAPQDIFPMSLPSLGTPSFGRCSGAHLRLLVRARPSHLKSSSSAVQGTTRTWRTTWSPPLPC